MKILNPTQEELSQKPLYTLYQAYITANAAAEKDPTLFDDARKIFMNLECGKHEDISDWKMYKELVEYLHYICLDHYLMHFKEANLNDFLLMPFFCLQLYYYRIDENL